MPTLSFTANLRRHLPVADLEVGGSTVREALEQAFAAQPQLRSYLVDDQGRLRPHVNIFVNERRVADRLELSDALAPGDRLWVLQALSGG